VSHCNIIVAKYYSGELGEMCMAFGEGNKIVRTFDSENSGSNAEIKSVAYGFQLLINPLNAELNPICYFLALLEAHHFLHVSRIRVKSLTLRLLMSYIYIYIYGAPILDVSRSHTTTQHSR